MIDGCDGVVRFLEVKIKLLQLKRIGARPFTHDTSSNPPFVKRILSNAFFQNFSSIPPFHNFFLYHGRGELFPSFLSPAGLPAEMLTNSFYPLT
ncbi:hypothetical protein HAX54_029567, partial [Datura stramonium]|nr:hypothetical protein [Datura stramonium]